jgi:hypothetical protein
MRTALVSMLLTLVGCSSAPPLALVKALLGEERSHARGLLAADATLVNSQQTVGGRELVYAALSVLPAGGRASGHHDVAELVQSEAVLFAMGSDAVRSLVLFDAERLDEPPAVLDDYVAVWNEPDPAVRETLLDGFAASGRYVDPTVDAVGREAFARHLTAFRSSQPGTTLERSSQLRRAGDWYLFEWVMKSGGRTLPGVDIVQLDPDGRVLLVAGFF